MAKLPKNLGKMAEDEGSPVDELRAKMVQDQVLCESYFKFGVADYLKNQDMVVDIERQIELVKEVLKDLKEEFKRVKDETENRQSKD